MIWFWSVRCNSSPPDNAVPKNSIECGEKEPREFYNRAFAGVLLLVTSPNRFGERKNLPNTGETQLVPTGVIDEKIDALLTTSHMFSPNERRQTAFLLPIWLPNPGFLRRKSDPGPRRGVVARAHPLGMLYR